MTVNASTSPSVGKPDLGTDLARIVVVASCRLKASFTDGAVLVLSDTADSFIVVQGGKVSSQLSQYALSRHIPRLATAMEFRNLHLDRPYVHSKLQPDTIKFSCGHTIDAVSWPSSVEAASQAGLLTQTPLGGTQLEAEGGTARMVIHPHSEVPQRWLPPFRLASAACQAFDRVAQHSQHSQQGHRVTESSKQADGQAEGYQHSGSNISELPTATSTGRGHIQHDQAESWWLNASTTLLPPDEVVHFEWTPEATYQYVADLQEVEAWIHADDSCLMTHQQGQFLVHCRTATDRGHMYAADSVPSHAWDAQNKPCYLLNPIAAHACMLREVCAAVSKQTQPSAGYHDSYVPPHPWHGEDEQMLAERGATQHTTHLQEHCPQVPEASEIDRQLYIQTLEGQTGDWQGSTHCPDREGSDASAESSLPPAHVVNEHQRNEMVEALLARNAALLASLT